MFKCSNCLFLLFLCITLSHQFKVTNSEPTTTPFPVSDECKKLTTEFSDILTKIAEHTDDPSTLALRLKNSLETFYQFIPKLIPIFSPFYKPVAEIKPEDFGCLVMFTEKVTNSSFDIDVEYYKLYAMMLSIPGKWRKFDDEIQHPPRRVFRQYSPFEIDPKDFTSNIKDFKQDCDENKPTIRAFADFVKCANMTDEEIEIEVQAIGLERYFLGNRDQVPLNSYEEARRFFTNNADIIDRFHSFGLSKARAVAKEIREEAEKNKEQFSSVADGLVYLDKKLIEKGALKNDTCLTKIAMGASSGVYDAAQNITSWYFIKGVNIIFSNWYCSTVENHENPAKIREDLKTVGEEVVTQMTSLWNSLVEASKRYKVFLAIEPIHSQ